jgi:hypothetical protein
VKIFLEAHPKWKEGDYKIFQQMENEVLKRAA